jgi:hypothetical protein
MLEPDVPQETVPYKSTISVGPALFPRSFLLPFFSGWPSSPGGMSAVRLVIAAGFPHQKEQCKKCQQLRMGPEH